MDESRGNRSVSRRAFLAAGTVALAGAAGCAEPGADRAIGDSDAGAAENETALDLDELERADGSVYTALYERVIDSVALVHVSGQEDPRTGEETAGQGSTFVYDDHLVTNEHVVWGGDQIGVQYRDGTWADASVVGSDPYSDLAVLDVDHVPDGADSLAFADDLPTVGQEVVAVGNPYGFEGSMSTGVVSGVNRSLPGPGTDSGQFNIPNAVQTDAAVNPGNSGGPLIDTDGAVVGVINAGAGQTIGFAISAALAGRVVPTLIASGEYRHARIGITYEPVDPAVAAANGLTEARGILVVGTDDPAAGVLQGSDRAVRRDGREIPVGGDVIVELNGHPTPDRHAVSMVLALETSPGDEIDVVVRRDGQRVTERLTLGARDPDPVRPY